MPEFSWSQIVVLLIGLAIICIPWIVSVVCLVLFPALATAEHLGQAAVLCCIFDLMAAGFIDDLLKKKIK